MTEHETDGERNARIDSELKRLTTVNKVLRDRNIALEKALRAYKEAYQHDWVDLGITKFMEEHPALKPLPPRPYTLCEVISDGRWMQAHYTDDGRWIEVSVTGNYLPITVQKWCYALSDMPTN